MWPYFAVWAIPSAASLFFGPTGRRVRWTWSSGALVLILTAYIGLRFQVGADWRPYSAFLADQVGRTFSQALVSRDPIYSMLNWASGRMGLGIYGVNVLCGLIFSIGLVAFCRIQIYPWVAAVAASPFLLFIVPLSYTRQSVALGLFMLAIVGATQGKRLAPYGLMALGFAFHKSAAIILPIFALVHIRHPYARVMFIALVVAAAGMVAISEFDRVSDIYFDGELASRGALIRLGVNAVAAVLFLGLYKRMLFSTFERQLWMIVSIISLVMFIVAAAYPTSTFLDRVGIYFLPFQISVCARIPCVFKEKVVAKLAILIMALASLGTWLFYSEYAAWMVPYQNILFEVHDNPVQLRFQ